MSTATSKEIKEFCCKFSIFCSHFYASTSTSCSEFALLDVMGVDIEQVAMEARVKLSGVQCCGSWRAWHPRMIDFARCLMELTEVAKPFSIFNMYLCTEFQAKEAFKRKMLAFLGKMILGKMILGKMTQPVLLHNLTP